MAKKNTNNNNNDEITGIASTGNVDWSVFLQEGVIVTLTIKRYRGTTSVDFSELGIDDTSDKQFKNILSEYIMPGTKRLIPPEIEGQLKSIETSARQNLKEKGFDCTALASNGKFVPKSMYSEFKKMNEELQSRFYSIRDSFANDYNSIIEHVRKDYKVLAENLYMQSHPDAKKPSAKYVNSFVDKIISQIPSSDEIVASFEYTTVLSRIPANLLNVIAKKQNIDEKVMRIAATNQENIPSNKKTAKASKSSRQKIIDAGRAMGMDTADAFLLPDDENELDEIERDIRKSIKDQSKEMANDFVTDILVRVRNDASEGADAIIKSIEKNNGKLVGRASIKAHSLVNDLQKMNFYNDSNLEEKINALSEALGEDKSIRDVESVKKAAEDLKKWADGDLTTLHESVLSRKTKTPAQYKNDDSETKEEPKTQTTPNKATQSKSSTSTKRTTRKPKSSASKTKTSTTSKTSSNTQTQPSRTKKRTIKRRS